MRKHRASVMEATADGRSEGDRININALTHRSQKCGGGCRRPHLPSSAQNCNLKGNGCLMHRVESPHHGLAAEVATATAAAGGLRTAGHDGHIWPAYGSKRRLSVYADEEDFDVELIIRLRCTGIPSCRQPSSRGSAGLQVATAVLQDHRPSLH